MVGLAVLLLGACYSPKLGSPGYYCHENDNPACPDGQQCVSGRCVIKGGTVRMDGGMSDMRPGDMSMRPPDMVAVKTGCFGYVECLKACPDQACFAVCETNATTAAFDKYQMALSCGQQHCLDVLKCRIDTVAMRLVDATGCTGCCSPCLNNSLALLFGEMCVGTTDCNPSSCVSLYNICLADMP
jgi:hypothetical protein